MKTEYFIEVIETSTGKQAGKTFAGYSILAAERRMGEMMLIADVDHDRYHFEVVTYDTAPSRSSEVPG